MQASGYVIDCRQTMPEFARKREPNVCDEGQSLFCRIEGGNVRLPGISMTSGRFECTPPVGNGQWKLGSDLATQCLDVVNGFHAKSNKPAAFDYTLAGFGGTVVVEQICQNFVCFV